MTGVLALAGCTGRDIIGSADGWTPVRVSEGTVYVASRDGRVLALDAENGARRWVFDLRGDEGVGSVFGSPVVGERLVYVGGAIDEAKEGKLVALRKDRDSSGGIEEGEWEVRLPDAIVGGPVLAQDLVLVGSEDGNFYAFNAADGTEVWTFPTEGRREGKGKGKQIWSTPAVSDGVVYFGAMDDYVYALSLDEGLGRQERLLWKYRTDGAVNSTLLVLDDVVIVGSFDRRLYALDAKTGGPPRWSFKADAWFWAGPVSDGSLIFASSMDGKVHALRLDRQEGDRPEWVRDVGGAIVSTPFLVEDKLVVATEDGELFQLSTSNGIVQEIPIEIGKAVRSSLSGEGREDETRVYFGDRDSMVWSVDVDRWTIRWKKATKQ